MENLIIILPLMLMIISQQASQVIETIRPHNEQIQNSQFVLSSGIPPYADPTPLVYDGNVKLKGSIIYKAKYIDDLTPHFRVDEDSLIKLPQHISHTDFILTVPSENDSYYLPAPIEIIDELERKSKGEPVTILVDRLEVHMEGSPSLNLVDYDLNH